MSAPICGLSCSLTQYKAGRFLTFCGSTDVNQCGRSVSEVYANHLTAGGLKTKAVAVDFVLLKGRLSSSPLLSLC